MLNFKRFLCLDIGASTVKLAQFTIGKDGQLILEKFNSAEVSVDPSQQEQHSPITSDIIRELIRETGAKKSPTLLAVPGQSVFTRFVKLPAVEETRVVQIIQYEAQQNVPFPMDEVVWDYQLIGAAEQGELEVVLVAIKSEIIEELTDTVRGADLRLEVVDVAPMALYNAARFNYPEWFAPDAEKKECVVLLDIGARTSNLVFVESNKIFSRSIPIAGNAITQAIATEFGLSFREAEQLKRDKGMVGLGGAYEDPPDETQARASKIIRNVILQLNADINRTINFYRTQRGGGAPTRMLLSGGSSILPYLDRFFVESLHVPVEFFNPFRSVQFGAGVTKEQLQQCAHFFGEVVGVALRRAADCPIQVSLMPPKVIQARAARARLPYFAATGVCIFVTLLCWKLYYDRLTTEIKNATGVIESDVRNFKKNDLEIREQQQKVQVAEQKLNEMIRFVDSRTMWLRLLDEINEIAAQDRSMWVTDIRFNTENIAPQQGGGFAPEAPVGIQNTRITELFIQFRGVADFRVPANNTKKAEAVRQRFNGQDKKISERDNPMLQRGSAEIHNFVMPPPPLQAANDFERYSFSFWIRVKLAVKIPQ
jgi:type IV pilus assembly protein PilM